MALSTWLLWNGKISSEVWGFLTAGIAGIKQVDSFRQSYFAKSDAGQGE